MAKANINCPEAFMRILSADIAPRAG